MPGSTQPHHIDAVARAVADDTRRSILRLVRDEERSAGDLAAEFPNMTRPAVSQHLAVLRDADLVTVRSQGNHRLYRARTEGLTEMREFLEDMWGDRLARLKLAAERAEWPDRQRAAAKKKTDQNSEGEKS